MQLLQFLIILGVFWKGHCTLDTKLLRNYHINRRLLVVGGSDSTVEYVYFSAACSATAISATAIVAGGEGSLDICKAPTDAACGDDKISLEAGVAKNGLFYYGNVSDLKAPDLLTEGDATECSAIGWGGAESKQSEKLAAVNVTLGTEGEDGSAELTASGEDNLCPGDVGGAVVCGDKLWGIISKVDACGTQGTGIKFSKFLDDGGNGGPGSEGGAEGGTTSAPTGAGATITLSMFIVAFPIIIIIGLLVN